MIATPSDKDMAIMWFSWFGISTIVSILTVMVFLGVVSNKKVRKNPFNVYLIFLMIPDMVLTIPCGIACLLNGIAGHFLTAFSCQAQSFYSSFGMSANAWLNAVVCYHLYVMLLATKQCVPYVLPKISTVVKHSICVYLWAAFVASWGLWTSFSSSPPGQQSRWWPHQTMPVRGTACIPMNYDDASSVFFFVIYVPALMGIPMIYFMYIAYQIYKHQLLPQSGNRRLLSIYFLRLAAVFFATWLPGLLLFFIIGPLVNHWLFWLGGTLMHLQGGLSAAVSMLKPDVYKAVRDYWTCRRNTPTLPTTAEDKQVMPVSSAGRNSILQGIKLQVPVGIDNQNSPKPAPSSFPVRNTKSESAQNGQALGNDQQSQGRIRLVLTPLHTSSSGELRLLASNVDGSVPATTETSTKPSIGNNKKEDNNVYLETTPQIPHGRYNHDRDLPDQTEDAATSTIPDPSTFENSGTQSLNSSLPLNDGQAMESTATSASADTVHDRMVVDSLSPVQQVLETALNLIRESINEENDSIVSLESLASQRSRVLESISDALTATRAHILRAQQQPREQPQRQRRPNEATTYVGQLPPLPRSAVGGINFPTITSSVPGCHALPATATSSLALPPLPHNMPPLPWMLPSGDQATIGSVLRIVDEVLSIVGSEIESIASGEMISDTRSLRSVSSNLETALEERLDAVNNMMSSSPRQRQTTDPPPTSQAATTTTATPWVPNVVGGYRRIDISVLSSTIVEAEEDDNDQDEEARIQ